MAENHAEDERGITRRQFLQGVAGTAAAVAAEALEKPTSAEASTEFRGNEVIVENIKETMKPIDFAVEQQPITAEAKSAIAAIEEYQRLVAADGMADSQETVAGFVTPTAEQTAAHEDAYQAVAQVLHEETPFSPEQYKQVMQRRFPEAMAQYGIFAKSVLAIAADETGKDYFGVITNFFSVESAKHTVVETAVGDRMVPLVNIGPLVLDGEGISSVKTTAPLEGQTRYKSVLIYKEGADTEAAEKKQQIQETKERIGSEGLLDIQSRAEKIMQAGKTVEERQVLAMQLGSFVSESYIQDFDVEVPTRVVAHEMGHLFYQNEETLGLDQVAAATSALELMQAQSAEGVRDETMGMLGELMFTEKKSASLSRILDWGSSEYSEFSYRGGAQWIAKELVAAIAAEPEKFGLIDLGEGVDAELSALLQLPEIGRDYPEQITELAQKLLSDKSKIASINLVDPKFTGAEKTADSSLNGALAIGLSSLAGVAALWGLKWVSDRRTENKLKKQVAEHKAKRPRKGSKKK